MKKTFSGTTLTLLLMTALTLALNNQPVKADGTIFLRPDGSVDPSTKPIQRVGDVYTFTDNIYESIVIQRDSIIIDGNNFTVRGTGTGIGLNLINRTNVTVRNIRVTDFKDGIRLRSSFGNTLDNNIVINNTNWGIEVGNSSNNIIIGNTVIESLVGIPLSNSTHNTIIRNTVTNNFEGIYTWNLSRNIIIGNIVTDNAATGIVLRRSSNNNISGNIVDSNYWNGISVVHYSSNNTVTRNTISNNRNGIAFWHFSNETGNHRVFYNNFINNTDQAKIIHDITITNQGITQNNTVRKYVNVWDDGREGNYWSNHNPSDENMDKIGDIHYIITKDNVDRYPLIYPYGFVSSTDLNADGIVNMTDIETVAAAFKSEPGDDNWNPMTDMDINEMINILDIAKVAREFEEII